jgi:hypothetical protein
MRFYTSDIILVEDKNPPNNSIKCGVNVNELFNQKSD